MTDEPENFTLAFLRKIDAKLDQLTFEVREVKSRLSTMELAISNVSATEAGHYASVSSRLDRLEIRLDRIETRLGLIEAAP